jgi:flagellar basal-body rod protein FlgF
MDPAYYVAAGSLNARSLQLDVLANNLANASTVGYKSERTFFQVFNKATQSARNLPLTRDVNDGTVVAQRGLDMSQGSLKQTNASLDVAIQGDAFFQVRTPQGVRATRDGRFKLGKDGVLQALDGSPVMGKNGQSLTLDPALPVVAISADGIISQGSSAQEQKTIGQIDLKAYANPSALVRTGALRFDASGQQEAVPKATVAQGYLEQSGVDVAACMVEMIRINRLFEMSEKVASTLTNNLDAHATNDLAGLR